MAIHYLDPARERVVEVFSRELPPTLTVDPGDTVVARSLDARGYLERQLTPGECRPRMFNPRRGHCLAGPIAIRGAEPGMVLSVRLVSMRTDNWGWTVAGHRDTGLNRRLGVGDPPSWLLWELDSVSQTGTNDRGFTVGLAPFLGVIGLPPDEPGEHPTRIPRASGGGNIDCRDLVAGSCLFIPITVPGALLCVGDGHAAQGNGEVGGSAIECGMTTELVLDLIVDPPIPTIHAVTPTHRITFGFSEDLNEAMVQALNAMLDWMQLLLNLDKVTALALASATLDLRITQVVNDVWGVHAALPMEVECRKADARGA